jgi:hypothetical protein
MRAMVSDRTDVQGNATSVQPVGGPAGDTAASQLRLLVVTIMKVYWYFGDRAQTQSAAALKRTSSGALRTLIMSPH